jgi:succinate-semialdehyde dehydrogenase/glutarate-semialdehyde dehydrogenase
MEAGKHLKGSTKLGGNDVFIILEDAEMENSRMGCCRKDDNGQSCIASKRFIAVEAIADEFIQKFKDALSKLSRGSDGSCYSIRSLK